MIDSSSERLSPARRVWTAPAFFVIFALLMLSLKWEAARRYEYSRGAMGVQTRIVLHSSDRETADAAAAAAFARIHALERTLSDYDPSSELRQLEKTGPGVWRQVSPDLLAVLVRSLTHATETGGAFDPTVGALTRLWRRARETGIPPTAEALAEARSRVGIPLIEVDRARSRIRFRRAGVELDFGGIGKGFAADEALAVLRENGCASALVDLGGDLALGAPPPGGPGWPTLQETERPGSDQAK